MNTCEKIAYQRLSEAQTARDTFNSQPGRAKLHVYACQVCPFTWHLGHKNHAGAPETRTRGRRHRRQREQMQYQRWDDDGGRVLPVWGEA